jgi:hypothetical protein
MVGNDVLSGKEAFDALALMAGAGGIGGMQAPLHSLLDQNPDLLRRLDRLDPIYAASIFAGLLTAPQLQANCYRIEALVHLALALGRGKQKASDKLVAHAFRELGTGLCGLMEDPSEDVFVTAV